MMTRVLSCANTADCLQFPALVHFPWLQPLSPSTHISKMQQLVFSAFIQLQQQQGHLLKRSQLQQQQQWQQQLHTSAPRHAAGSHAFLSQTSTLPPSMSQQHSIHQQAVPCAQTCHSPCTSQPSVAVQFSGAHQGFKQPPGAPCSMPQSSRRKQFPATSLPDGYCWSGAPCSFAPAACRATAKGRAAHPTAPASGPGLLHVTKQISHDQQIAKQTPDDQHLDREQKMEDQTVLVTFPVDMSGYKQLASANSHSAFGKIQELSLVTCTGGSEASTMTCRHLLFMILHLTSLTHGCKARLLINLSLFLHMSLCLSQNGFCDITISTKQWGPVGHKHCLTHVCTDSVQGYIPMDVTCLSGLSMNPCSHSVGLSFARYNPEA